MNVTRRQIKHALSAYENKVRLSGRSSDVEMHLYEALAGVVRGRIIDEPPVTVSGADELADLPVGSVITSALPDVESNVAEKTSDGFWLVTGEEKLITNAELAEWADDTITVLQKGYSDD